MHFLVEYLFADKMEKKLTRLLQLILVTFITFIILDDTSELRTLEGRLLNDPPISRLFEEPGSDTEHDLKYEQEPVPRKRKPQTNKKAAKKNSQQGGLCRA